MPLTGEPNEGDKKRPDKSNDASDTLAGGSKRRRLMGGDVGADMATSERDGEARKSKREETAKG